MDHQQNFFVYQRRALRPMLLWGIASSIGGALLLPFPGAVRHFGLQALSWGAIDLALAVVGRRQALLKAEALASHQIDESAAHAAAESFRRILIVNGGLDVLYILAGLWTARRFAERPDRRGLGLGIALQGLFLLLFDSLLARDIGERWT